MLPSWEQTRWHDAERALRQLLVIVSVGRSRAPMRLALPQTAPVALHIGSVTCAEPPPAALCCAAVHLIAELQRAFPDEMRSGGWGQRAVQFASAIVNAAAATTDVVPSTVADAGADANAPMPHAQTASLALLPALELLCVTGCTECLEDLLTGEGCLGLLSWLTT